MSARSSSRVDRLASAGLALLALAACNAADRPANDVTAAPPSNVATAPILPARARSEEERQPTNARLDELEPTANAAAPAPDGPEAVTRSWFAGRWTDTGDCADAAEFAANGTYLLADGTRGMWNVQDSRLVVQNSGGRTAVRLRRVGSDAVETIGDDGSVGRSTRC